MAAQQNLPEVLVIDNGTAFESGLRGGDSRVTVTTSSVGAIGGILPLGRTGYLRSDLVYRYAVNNPTQEALDAATKPLDQRIEMLQGEIERTGNALIGEKEMHAITAERLQAVTTELNAAKAQHIVTTGQLAQAEATLASFNAKAKEDTQPEHPAG